MSRWIYAVLCIVVPVLLVITCIFIIEGFHRPSEEAKRDVSLPLGQNLPLPDQLSPAGFAPQQLEQKRAVMPRV